ncbi:MAG: hypothetical protein HZA54_03140, partial [Planctomycetes bacterium]|nr:hypothetical protein [Planctomycetota bacterium]
MPSTPTPVPVPTPRTLADALAAALADGAARLRSGRSRVRDLGDLEGIHLMR